MVNAEHPELKRRSDLVWTDASLVDDKELVQKIVDLDYAAYRQDRPEIRNVIHKIIQWSPRLPKDFQCVLREWEKTSEGSSPRLPPPPAFCPSTF